MLKGLQALFATQGAPLTVRQGAPIVTRGDARDNLYYLADGRALMHSASILGRAVAFEILGPGRVFGWGAMISDGVRRFDVTALKRCQLWYMRRERFTRALMANPDCAVEALSVCAAVAGERTKQLEDLALCNLEERLAKWILNRFRDEQISVRNGHSIPMIVSQAVIAQMIGMSRESVNKQLQKWCSQNVIAVRGRQLRIVDAAELQRCAGSEVPPQPRRRRGDK